MEFPGITKTLSWFAPEGTALADFIPTAILVAIISQILVIGLLFLQKVRWKSLSQKLHEERELNKQMRSSTKEIEKKISAQEKALESAKTVGEKAALLEEELKSEQEREKACRNNADSLKDENKQLRKELSKSQRSEKQKEFMASFRAGWTDGIGNVRQKLRNIFHTG
jgi:predicted  nucleic acid-binding Zn-ribbon protein